MKTYKTSEVAKIIGIHPNTVRLYEEWGFIPKAQRQGNRYRVFTEFHVAQFRLARLALQSEVIQNGLRKKMIKMIKASASGDFTRAIELTNDYLAQVGRERENAEEAIAIARQILAHTEPEDAQALKRKEAAEYLNLSMDTIRNWEMNGLLSVKRRENGYRVYTGEDIRRLKMIRSLRCANYSLEAILRLLRELSLNPEADLQEVLNTPKSDDTVISVCDKLIDSLRAAEQNALALLDMLRAMQAKFGEPSTIPPVF